VNNSTDLIPNDKDAMRSEYDFSEGVRGKYFERYWHGRKIVQLDEDVAKDFPNSESVNEALRKYRALAKNRRTG
jgi:hypothetical protein